MRDDIADLVMHYHSWDDNKWKCMSCDKMVKKPFVIAANSELLQLTKKVSDYVSESRAIKDPMHEYIPPHKRRPELFCIVLGVDSSKDVLIFCNECAEEYMGDLYARAVLRKI